MAAFEMITDRYYGIFVSVYAQADVALSRHVQAEGCGTFKCECPLISPLSLYRLFARELQCSPKSHLIKRAI